ncbi:peroxisomal multifunctional enzyme type 2-like isoform X2 [Cylas formicarius]|uniref:peroxisomal multifunctional enzyme type 2-like isoform X2 n=1 Tax=Cylas formicarius TaxID=197179 RepID=UPI002958C040|nr:peroxisomal multifunctional enzyme type 2-like isoform X2 [Cylas formicarius]
MFRVLFSSLSKNNLKIWNFGQANYSAAKMALVGLAKTIAIEGASSNVYCNVIVPTAASRLTQDILPPEIYDELKPELIAPVVGYLSHESCSENGSIIEAAAGWAGKCSIVRSNGSVLRSNIKDNVTLENVKENWGKIVDMSDAKTFQSIQDVTGALVGSLEGQAGTTGDSGVDSGSENEDIFNFSDRDTILYALGVGASLKNPKELKFLYENHEDFQTLPTFYILPSLQANFNSDFTAAVPGKDVNLSQVLHGEQYLEVFGDLQSEGQLISKVTIAEVLDKGSGAVVVTNVDSLNQKGDLVARNQIVIFAVGAGNFGGPRTGTKTIPCQNKPDRSPDASVVQKTSIDQAALYRLSGDRNPLHIDPGMAAVSGFDRPILHGLCSLGFSVRAVLETFADYDASLFKACKVRFTKPVIPGQSLRVDMWKVNNRIHFETIVVETNTAVITGAYVDLKSVKLSQVPPNMSDSNLKSDAIFEFIIEQVNADPSKAKSIGGVFLYNITKDGKQVKQWTMDLKNAKVFQGTPEGKPSTTLTISDEDFLLLAEGKLQPQQAFMKGKLKITGNLMLAQKLAPLLKTNAKL